MNYNPLSPEVKANPYPYYAELRRDHPVYQVESFNAFAVSRYEDVAGVLMDPEAFSSTGFGETNIRSRPTNMLVAVDPPDHTRLRSLVNRAFTPKMIADLEPRIHEVTQALLDRVRPKGRMDLVADFAIPLPVTIIAEILGVEPERREDFKRWSDAVVGHRETEAKMEAYEELMNGFMGYFEAAIDERRAAPRGDMISTLVRAETEEHAISADEVVAFTLLLLVAGNETTTNLIGNAIVALLDNPSQLRRVRSDGPPLAPNLVEEALRYDAPVQFLFRKATRDVEVAGTVIPKDAIVLPVYGSANRDERKYADAERFDVTRDAQGHLAFGHGIHFCLGAPLARLEAKIALEALLKLENLTQIDDRVEQIDSPYLRGPKRLELAFAPIEAGVASGAPRSSGQG